MSTTKTRSKTTSDVEVGLAELSGVQLCAMPGCYRQLKSGQGKQTLIGRVCFGHPGVAS